MKILKLVKNFDNKYEIILLNEDLSELITKELFEDLYTMNFFLQTIQKKFNFHETLIIIHDKINNKVDIIKNNGEIFIPNSLI